MTEKVKKTILIIGFLILVVSIAFAIYYLFFKTTITPTQEETTTGELTQLPLPGESQEVTTTTPETQIPTVSESTGAKLISRVTVEPGEVVSSFASGGITTVSDIDYEVTPFISLDSTGNNLYTYNKDSGLFYQLDDNGEKTLLTETTFKNVENVTWNSQDSQAILEFPDGSNVFYDFETDKQITLPQTWEEFEFNSTGDLIAFKDMDITAEKRFLGIANPDGSGQSYIEYLGTSADDVDVLWAPNNSVVATIKKGGGTNTSEIYLIGPNDENYKSLEVNGLGVQMQYTPDSEKILYSAYNSYSDNKPVLYLVDANGANIGQNNTSLQLNTWADKCTFSDDSTVYCAVPKEMPEGAGFLPELADNIADYIYKIDLNTGVTSFIAEPEYDYTIDSMQVSEDGSTLYFTDKATQTVHKINLQ